MRFPNETKLSHNNYSYYQDVIQGIVSAQGATNSPSQCSTTVTKAVVSSILPVAVLSSVSLKPRLTTRLSPAASEPSVIKDVVQSPAASEPSVIKDVVQSQAASEPSVIKDVVQSQAASEPSVIKDVVQSQAASEPSVIKDVVQSQAASEPSVIKDVVQSQQPASPV